jgi:hypothetical protein
MALLQKGYLGATPLWRQINWYEDGSPNLINASSLVTLTANTAAHTKGSWSQVIASTSANVSFLWVRVSSVNTVGANTATLIDLGTGASGSEVAFASNIAVGGASAVNAATLQAVIFGIPVKIASGTRIAARIQSVVTGGKTGAVEIFATDTGDYATTPTTVDVIGTDTATSQGTSFSGASGTWVEGIASTSQAYRAIGVVLSTHDTSIGNLNNAQFEVGVGASGSEVAFGSLRYNFNADERLGITAPFTFLFGRNIPAGSRLSVKHPFTSTPERQGFCLIGIP